jgi:hypothetical protein
LRRPLPFHLIGAAVAALAITACGGDDDPTPQDDVTPVEAAIAARAAVIGVQTGYSGSSTMIAEHSNKPERTLAPQHLFGLVCPDVTLGGQNSVTVLTLDYGPAPGCTSELDGQVHSGTVTIGTNGLALNPITFDFTSYTTATTAGDFAIDGGIEGTINLPARSVALEIVDLLLSGPSGTTAVDGMLTGSLNNNDTPLVLTDDAWTIRGEMVVTADQKVYIVEIEEAAPILLRTDCAWPLSGRVAISVVLGNSGATSPPAALDFGAGTCDDLALVTVGGVTTTVHLSTGLIAD